MVKMANTALLKEQSSKSVHEIKDVSVTLVTEKTEKLRTKENKAKGT